MTKDELFINGSAYQVATRDQIVGIDNILEKIDTIIYWLKNFQSFTNRKSRLEPGILLEGQPGTGKTLCSRYIATESEALFVNIRDWPLEDGIFTASDIAEIFVRARQYYYNNNCPVILFWDEFENYAMDRGGISAGGGSKASPVVSQLTSELDGIHGKPEGILLIACTNYKDVIDHALLRAGRMGIHIHFTAPNRKGKSLLFEHYLSRFNVGDIDYDSSSYFFEDFSNAASVEEAAETVWLHAVMNSLKEDKDPTVTSQFVNDILLDRLLGPIPPFMELTPEDEYRVAVHEIGHALVAKGLGVPIKIVTIRAGEMYFGRTFIQSVHEKISRIEDVYNQICILLGSVESESIAEVKHSTALDFDTYQASKLANDMANYIGYNDQAGLLNLRGLSDRNFISDKYVEVYDYRAADLIYEARGDVVKMIGLIGKDKIHELAVRLQRDKTWTGKQFNEVYNDVLQVRGDAIDRSSSDEIYTNASTRSIPLYRERTIKRETTETYDTTGFAAV